MYGIFTGSGKYIYYEASSPVQKGEIARLTSVTLPANVQLCVRLWYYMWGDEMGYLKVKAKVSF